MVGTVREAAMQLFMRKRRRGEIEFGIVYGTIALCALVAGRVLPVFDLLPSCMFRSAVGIPCPTCGATRSLVHLAHGDLPGAIAQNPLFAAGLLAALVWMAVSTALILLRSPRFALVPTWSEGTLIRLAAVVLFLLNWAYLLVAA